jgi:hypothetical protein
MEAVGTYEYQRLGESGLVRLEAPFVIKYLGKGTLGANDDKSVDALTQERITFDLVHVFDGISAYWDISSIEAKTTTPPEERTIPSRVVQTVEDKLGNNELYGLYPQHVLRQNPSGWTWELLPDATVDGTALSMIAAQPDKETVVAQKIARYQFSFDKTTGILVESEMFDKDENRVGKVEFANIKVNAVIAAGRFQYTPPAGIKLEPPPVF